MLDSEPYALRSNFDSNTRKAQSNGRERLQRRLDRAGSLTCVACTLITRSAIPLRAHSSRTRLILRHTHALN